MSERPALRIAAGLVSELVVDQVRVVPLPRSAEGRPREALVLRDEAGVIRAYENRCKHLPIPLDVGSRDFYAADGLHLECRTHGARFRLRDGFCVVGPCSGATLDGIALEQDGDALFLLLPS